MDRSGCQARSLIIAVLVLTTGCSAANLQAPRLSFEGAASTAADIAQYRSDTSAALDRALHFFRAQGLQLPAGPLIERVVIFESPVAARKYFHDHYGVPLDQVPDTFAGTVQDKTLYLVTKAAYREIWRTTYPQWAWSDIEYRRLIVHELVHAAHEGYARTKLGSADAMGPTWFFEGFAVMAADQFERPLMTAEQVKAQFAAGGPKGSSYPEFGRIVRSLGHAYGLKRVVDHAGEAGFPQLLWEPQAPR